MRAGMVGERLRLAFVLVIAGVLSMIGCGGVPPDEVRVGAFLSLSGEETQFGIDTQQGIDLATFEVNGGGGIKGKRVKLVYEDDKSNPQEATQKVRQLIDRSHVVAVLGEVASSRSLSGGLIANAAHVPMISPSSTNVKVTKGRDYVFRVCFTDDAQGVAAAEFVAQKLGKKRVAILYAAQDPYSSGLASSFRQAIVRMGATIVADKGFQKSEKNFRTYLSQLMDERPEMIFAPIYYTDMVPIAQQAKDAGIPGSLFVGGDGWDSEDLLKGAGAELDGAYFTNHYAPDVPWENSKRFVAAFKAHYGREPSSLAAQGYDAAKLLYDAMDRAPTLAPDDIRAAIAGTKNFSGATGTISMDRERNADKPLVVVKIKDGAFHYEATVNEGGAAKRYLEGAAPPPKVDESDEPPRDFSLKFVLAAVLTGLAQGAMIALVALGYTMVYGILKLINFAHSEVFMMGAFAGYFLLTGFAHLPVWLALAICVVGAMAASSALGIVVERVAYRPILSRGSGAKGIGSRVTPLVTALGVSVLLQNLATLVFNARPKSYPRILPNTQIVIFVTAIVVMGALYWLVNRTWLGKAMRALSTNEEAARLQGIRTSRVIAFTFALGSSLAALGAVLYCFDQSQAFPTMGQQIGTRAFVAAVLGGIGSIPGAVLGGILLGVVGELSKLTSYSGGQDVLTFLVLIGVLLWRPTGLLGKGGVEKV